MRGSSTSTRSTHLQPTAATMVKDKVAALPAATALTKGDDGWRQGQLGCCKIVTPEKQGAVLVHPAKSMRHIAAVSTCYPASLLGGVAITCLSVRMPEIAEPTHTFTQMQVPPAHTHTHLSLAFSISSHLMLFAWMCSTISSMCLLMSWSSP